VLFLFGRVYRENAEAKKLRFIVGCHFVPIAIGSPSLSEECIEKERRKQIF
jgi:hypothetical protein